MAQEKEYGLIIPGTNKAKPTVAVSSKTKNVFGDDSSDDEESAVDWVKQSLKKQSHGSMQQKQSMKVMNKALEDDPSVFAYDEVYDEMEKKKAEVKERLKGDKKPKYIHSLLKVAKTRELENELRKERLAQKEREDEGDMYKDKEAFVTSAYRKKMETIREMQNDQAYQDAVDDSTEVTKQKDLSGFYRFLYREKMKEEDDPKESGAISNESEKPSVNSSKDSSPQNLKLDSEISKPEEYSPENRPIKRERSSQSPETRDSNVHDERRNDDSHRRRRSRSSSHGREKRRRHDSSEQRRRDAGRDRRDNRGRDRDETNRSRHDRYRRSRSRDRGRDERVRKENEPHWPHDRQRYYDRDDKDKEERLEKCKTDDKGNETKQENNSQSSPTKNSRLKIIQKENWYDFDVEIERDVNKEFYTKRTVGKAFDDALQRYLMRKGPDQMLDSNSKHL